MLFFSYPFIPLPERSGQQVGRKEEERYMGLKDRAGHGRDRGSIYREAFAKGKTWWHCNLCCQILLSV